MKTLRQPTKEEVLAARRAAGHTQAQAADTVHLGTSHRWYEYEAGSRNMDVSRWELYLLKTGLHPRLKVNERKVTKPLPKTDALLAASREPAEIERAVTA